MATEEMAMMAGRAMRGSRKKAIGTNSATARVAVRPGIAPKSAPYRPPTNRAAILCQVNRFAM